MIFKFHIFHSKDAHYKAFRKTLVLLLLALLPQWVNLILGGLADNSGMSFLSLNDTLIYSFSFLAPALLMTYDIFNGKDDSSKSGISESYFWIFIIAVCLLLVNIILYTVQISLSEIDIAKKIPISLNYVIFSIALYIWYTTILYQYFELTPEGYSKRTNVQVQKKVQGFREKLQRSNEAGME